MGPTKADASRKEPPNRELDFTNDVEFDETTQFSESSDYPPHAASPDSLENISSSKSPRHKQHPDDSTPQPVVVPTHLPRRQQELFKRVLQHQRQNAAASGSDSENQDSKPKEVVEIKKEQPEPPEKFAMGLQESEWYTSEEENDGQLLKKIQQAPPKPLEAKPNAKVDLLANFNTIQQKTLEKNKGLADAQQKSTFWQNILGGVTASKTAAATKAGGKAPPKAPVLRNTPSASGGVTKRIEERVMVQQCSSSDEETIEQKTVVSNNVFLMWQNNKNLCWLDASMALIVHNVTLIESLTVDSSSQITKIAEAYYEAYSIINNCSDERHIEVRVKVAKDVLKNVQETVLKYLQPIMKHKEGVPDSAFCALFNLISEDKSTKECVEVEFTWSQSCKMCSSHRVHKHKKPIVTLPKVIYFQAQCPVAIYQCLKCKEPNQEMTLSFQTLPQCLLFHFESGAGLGELKFDFEVDGRTYRLTGVMTLEKGKDSVVKHFITFVRNADRDIWLECNDLNDKMMCFRDVPPTLKLEDIYILMYEANDNRGTIENRSLLLDKRGLGEESVSSSADIPFIDLTDDT